MVIRFTLEEAEQYKKLSKELLELEQSVANETYINLAHDILNVRVLKNKTLLSSVSDFIKKDILTSIESLKEKISALGKEYKN